MATLVSPSLQRLLVNVRNLLNQPDRTTSFWTDEELTEYINEAVRMYFQEVSLNNEGLFTTQTDLDIIANNELVALPSDFFEIRAVYKAVTNGFIMLPYRNNLQEGYSTQGGTSSDNYLPYYYFRGNSLVLRPIANFAQTAGIRIEYVQFPSTMVDGGDALTNQVSPVFKQLVEMYAVYKAKLKESLVTGTNTAALAKENLGDIYKLFKDSISLRSKNPIFISPFNPESQG